ncbi:MAG TPA: OmpA family protein [Albitalea sp.]|nr:OmpA family protein [Albitalea sp.]
MSDQDEGARNLALGVLAGVLGLVLAGTIAIGAGSAARHRSSTAMGVPQAPRTAYGPVKTLYFAQDSVALNAAAADALQRVAQTARAHPAAMVLVAAIQPQPVEASINPRLGYLRALAVRHALEAQGVAPDHISILRPFEAGPRDDVGRARRVDVWLE